MGNNNRLDCLLTDFVREEKGRKKMELDEAKMKQVKEDLCKTKEEHLARSYRTGKSYRPENGELVFEKDWMKHEDAYDQAIDHILKDPEHNICKIVYWWHIAGGGYSLMCWKASKDTPMIFKTITGGHVLFFSELCFKWKDEVPVRG